MCLSVSLLQALQHGFFDFDSFNVEEYEHYEVRTHAQGPPPTHTHDWSVAVRLQRMHPIPKCCPLSTDIYHLVSSSSKSIDATQKVLNSKYPERFCVSCIPEVVWMINKSLSSIRSLWRLLFFSLSTQSAPAAGGNVAPRKPHDHFYFQHQNIKSNHFFGALSVADRKSITKKCL